MLAYFEFDASNTSQKSWVTGSKRHLVEHLREPECKKLYLHIMEQFQIFILQCKI